MMNDEAETSFATGAAVDNEGESANVMVTHRSSNANAAATPTDEPTDRVQSSRDNRINYANDTSKHVGENAEDVGTEWHQHHFLLEPQPEGTDPFAAASDSGSIGKLVPFDGVEDGTEIHASEHRSNSDETGGARHMCSATNGFVLRCVLVTATTSLLLGYDQGVMSGAKLYIRREYALSDERVQLLVGILHVSAIGALFAGWLAKKIGRRWTVGLACVIFILGGLLMALANGFGMLIAGRVVTGVGVGTGLTVAPLYMAELSPKNVRGALVSLNEISINVGILLGFIAGWAFSGLDQSVSWRWMLGMGCLPPVVIGFCLFAMPESPRWLVKHGRATEAFSVLCRACSLEEARGTLDALQEEAASKVQSAWVTLFQSSKRSCGIWKLICAGVGVTFFQQASGLEAIMYYVPEIMEHAGVEDLEHQLLANLGVGAVKLIFVFLAVRYVDRFGRRTLLMWSGVGMAACLIIVACSFEAGDILGLTLTGLCLFMASFSLGFGPLTWVVASEVFPLQVRGPTLGIATFTNRVVSGIISLTYLSMASAMTPGGSFFFFGGVAGLSVLFVWLLLPETHNRTLEEIEAEAGVSETSTQQIDTEDKDTSAPSKAGCCLCFPRRSRAGFHEMVDSEP